jgi:LysM repeat protein
MAVSRKSRMWRWLPVIWQLSLVFALGAAPSFAIEESDYPAEAANPAERTPTAQVPPAASAEEAAEPPPAAATHESAPPAAKAHKLSGATTIPYTVRTGDSLGGIAAMFGLEVSDIARINHLDPEGMLESGRVLRLPNPFTAQVRSLTARVEDLTKQNEALSQKEQTEASQLESLGAGADRLKSENKSLTHRLLAFSWWRGMAVSAIVGSLLMLGITVLTLFEWVLLRRRFIAVAEMNDSLRRLDQKYRALIQKAELRFQQLYGRRRSSAGEVQERSKLPEEAQLERLSDDLKEILVRYLQRLGGRKGGVGRPAVLRDILGSVDPPLEARSTRR